MHMHSKHILDYNISFNEPFLYNAKRIHDKKYPMVVRSATALKLVRSAIIQDFNR